MCIFFLEFPKQYGMTAILHLCVCVELDSLGPKWHKGPILKKVLLKGGKH